MTETTSAVDDLELLGFDLAGVRYALPLHNVCEVLRAVLITPLPDAPDVIEGVIDVRGSIVPVYDLRARFRLPARALHPDDRIVLARTGERAVAFRAEHADLIGRMPASAIEPPERARSAGRHIAGVAKLATGIVLIQDLAAFLDDAESARLDAALSSAAAPDAE
jgi:purine-binding chemotaxis protein CheW